MVVNKLQGNNVNFEKGFLFELVYLSYLPLICCF